MNTNTLTHHLNQDELIRAVVDTNDLPSDRQHHLTVCPKCAQELERLTQPLTRLGRTAQQMTPAPKRPFRLPATPQPLKRRLLLPVWGVGLAAAILVAGVVFKTQWLGPQSQNTKALNASADRQLMKEVNALVDNALPEQFQQLATLSAPLGNDTSDADDDFLDWIAPDVDDDDSDEFLL